MKRLSAAARHGGLEFIKDQTSGFSALFCPGFPKFFPSLPVALPPPNRGRIEIHVFSLGIFYYILSKSEFDCCKSSKGLECQVTRFTHNGVLIDVGESDQL